MVDYTSKIKKTIQVERYHPYNREEDDILELSIDESLNDFSVLMDINDKEEREMIDDSVDERDGRCNEINKEETLTKVNERDGNSNIYTIIPDGKFINSNNGAYCAAMKGTRKTNKPARYLLYSLFKNNISENRPIVFVDMQLICNFISEIVIITDEMIRNDGEIYHRMYKILKTQQNRKQFLFNLNYNGITEDFNNKLERFNATRDEKFFKSLPEDAIYVFRGADKKRHIERILKRFKKRGSYYTFPDKFNNNFQCNNHFIAGSSCAYGNLLQMLNYYYRKRVVFNP